MRISPLVLLLFAMPGCGSGTDTAKTPAESSAAKTLDAATVKTQMTPAKLALDDPVVNSVGMLLVSIPAGEFQIGSPDSDSGESLFRPKPQHLVKITRPFYLGACEVTQQQFEKVMDIRPWQGRSGTQYRSDNRELDSLFASLGNPLKLVRKEGPDHPAVNVSWDDAVEFCRKLSKQEGLEYRAGHRKAQHRGRRTSSDRWRCRLRRVGRGHRVQLIEYSRR